MNVIVISAIILAALIVVWLFTHRLYRMISETHPPQPQPPRPPNPNHPHNPTPSSNPCDPNEEYLHAVYVIQDAATKKYLYRETGTTKSTVRLTDNVRYDYNGDPIRRDNDFQNAYWLIREDEDGNGYTIQNVRSALDPRHTAIEFLSYTNDHWATTHTVEQINILEDNNNNRQYKIWGVWKIDGKCNTYAIILDMTQSHQDQLFLLVAPTPAQLATSPDARPTVEKIADINTPLTLPLPAGAEWIISPQNQRWPRRN